MKLIRALSRIQPSFSTLHAKLCVFQMSDLDYACLERNHLLVFTSLVQFRNWNFNTCWSSPFCAIQLTVRFFSSPLRVAASVVKLRMVIFCFLNVFRPNKIAFKLAQKLIILNLPSKNDLISILDDQVLRGVVQETSLLNQKFNINRL